MKKVILPLALVLAFSSTSCLGPDPSYNSVKNWNAGLSDHDWVNEVVFLGLTIIPVYEFLYLGDILIFNTYNYWAGDSLIKAPGQFPGFTK